jgi:hypothetical protein
LFALTKIRPIGRNQDGIDIWRCEKKIQTAIPLLPTKYSDPLTLKGVARANNDYLFRNGLAVGSLSIDRSTRLTNHGSSAS